ncbi:hypothetical protein IFM89_002958 [Coptis chinensis]|uniref:Uncharacterized protein n=1 Tax=Coptis chinensis TaxID=261450 RepID=A0A835ILW0_9MAGN|nr:hypothetical protein IFM89_002958 [Coptis chinensis]
MEEAGDVEMGNMDTDSTTEMYEENASESEDADIGDDGNEGEVGVMNLEHLEPFNIEDPTYELYDVLEETGRIIQRGIDACADAIPADVLRYFRRAYQMTQTKFIPAGDCGDV